MKETNPFSTPTGIDLEQVKADYARDGYCIVPGVLSEHEVAAARKRLANQAAAERALGWARMKDGQAKSAQEGLSGHRGINQRCGMLINKGKDRKSTRLNSSHVSIS